MKIDAKIKPDDLNSLLSEKFNKLSPDKFNKFWDEISAKVETKQQYKNDFQSSKRWIILSNWLRENNQRKH